MSDIMAVLTQEGVDAEFAKLNSLAEALKAKSGTQAQRRREAGETALGGTAIVDYDEIPETVRTLFAYAAGWQDAAEIGIHLGDLAVKLAAVNEWAAHLHSEAVGVILKGQGTDSDLVATRKAFDEQKVRCEALLKVAAVIPGMDKLLEGKSIPNARTPRASGGGSKPAGKKFATFYRILPNGEKRYQSEQQDKFSSVAWYYGAAIMGKPGEGSANEGKGVPTTELENFLRANGCDSPQGKPWEYTVDLGDAGSVTFGMETVGDTNDEEE